MEAIIRTIFDQLDAHRVDYLVLRNYTGLPYRVSSDLDLLVSRRHLRRFLAIVTGVVNAQGGRVQSTPVLANGISVGASWNESGTGAAQTRLSIHAQLWVPFEISPAQRAVRGLSRKIFFEDLDHHSIVLDGCRFNIPAPVDEFVLLYRQWCFKQKADYLDRLTELQNVDAVRAFLEREGWRHAADFRREPPKDDWRALHRLVKARWGRAGVTGTARMYARAAAGAMQARGLLPASSIYLAGPDGAGKTTMAAMIKRDLEAHGVRCRHFYSMKKNLLRDLAMKIRSAWPSRPPGAAGKAPRFRWVLSEDITDRDDGTALWRLRKFVRLCFGIVDVGLCYLATLVFRWRGYTLIIETSPYDLFVKYHMPRFEWLERLFCPLIPRPQLGLMLRADPEAIHRRKTELTAAEIGDYYRRMDAIIEVAHAGDRFREIPTGDGPDAARESMRRVILDAL